MQNEANPPSQVPIETINAFNQFAESCPGTALISSGVGFGFGGALGLFLSSAEFSNVSQAQMQAIAKNANIPEPTFRQQVAESFKDMGRKSFSQAKSFGKIGGIYSAVDCVIEGYRAKHDIINPILSGAVTGGIITIRSGPGAMLFGSLSFAAFSGVMDYFWENFH